MGEPLYADVARLIKKAILAGVHQSGSFLPGEHELAETHGVSRATVRAALARLERNGFIKRQRGAGSLVLHPRPPAGFGQSVLTTEELIDYAHDTKRVVSAIDALVVDHNTAEILNAAEGSRWIRITSLRIDPANPARPLCASEAYISHELVPILPYMKETAALCDLIAEHCGIHTVCIDQELQGAIVPEELAQALDARQGSPALRILRRYRDKAGRYFLSNFSLHPADRFAYRTTLYRETASIGRESLIKHLD